MRIAIVHYHLRRGGVTTVINNALSALKEGEDTIAVIAGEEPPADGAPSCRFRKVPGLGYGRCSKPGEETLLAEALTRNAEEALNGPPDLWHFHNHALGKNTAVPLVVGEFARRGFRMLLQLHDFVEDNRSTNYRMLSERLSTPASGDFAQMLYPQASHVHYAVLNTRDRRFLLQSGVPESNLHILPNIATGFSPVAPDGGSGEAQHSRLFLYPTRAIRRKNIGEFLLWAACCEDADSRFATTLAPENPAALPRYRRWVDVAAWLGLPVDFALGENSKRSYPELLSSAFSVVTTSVAEGFGLCFLEPWLVLRPLLGRDLPHVTAQLKTAGIDLSGLYTEATVPLAWIDRELLYEKIASGLREQFRAYGRPVPEDAARRTLNEWICDERIDFGRLDETLQEQVIEKIAHDKGAAKELSPAGLVPGPSWQKQAAKNRRQTLQSFSLETYRKKLSALYRTTAASNAGAVESLDAAKLLDAFLDPKRLSLLRTSL